MTDQARIERFELRMWFAVGGLLLCVVTPVAWYMITAFCFGMTQFQAGTYAAVALLLGVLVLAMDTLINQQARDVFLWLFQIPRLVNLFKRNSLNSPTNSARNSGSAQ